jgi:hypothetical protein
MGRHPADDRNAPIIKLPNTADTKILFTGLNGDLFNYDLILSAKGQGGAHGTILPNDSSSNVSSAYDYNHGTSAGSGGNFLIGGANKHAIVRGTLRLKTGTNRMWTFSVQGDDNGVSAQYTGTSGGFLAETAAKVTSLSINLSSGFVAGTIAILIPIPITG